GSMLRDGASGRSRREPCAWRWLHGERSGCRRFAAQARGRRRQSHRRLRRKNRMALKRPKGAAGTFVVLEHTSKILKANPLRDPHVRKVGVWLPPQYDGSGARFPVLYDLVGFTGSGLAHANWKPFGDNVPERAARLIHEGKMGPAIIVFPDCF